MKWYLLIAALFICPAANAACPAGSTCTQYNGTVPYNAAGGNTARTPAARTLDHGVNILEFGADPTGVSDSTAAIQAAIDYAYNNNIATTFCPSGAYKTSTALFVDPPGNLRGNAAAWASGTTYAINNVVTYLGVPWASLGNSNVGNTPSATSTHWAQTTVSPSNIQFAVAFVGESGAMPAAGEPFGCRIETTFNNACAVWLGTGQGQRIDGIQILGPTVSGGAGYRGGQPSSGTGFCTASGSGGANSTSIYHSYVSNFYNGFSTGQNGDGLGAENTYFKDACGNVFRCIAFFHTQNFINSIYDCRCSGTVGVLSQVGVSVHVFGGNWGAPSESGVSNAFTLSSVSITTAANGQYEITATVSSPDTYLNSNIYNSFAVVTAHFGIIPMTVVSFNTGTAQIVLQATSDWASFFFNNGGINVPSTTDLSNEMAAVTTVYASERVTAFLGSGILVEGAHIENQSANTTILDEGQFFGASLSSELNQIDAANVDLSFFGYAPANSPTEAQLALYYIAKVFPLIRIGSANVSITNSTIGPGPANPTEPFLVVINGNQRFVAKNNYGLEINMWQLGSGASNSNGYQIGSPAMGGGEYDTNPFLSWGYWDAYSTDADNWKLFTGQSPMWGFRPAPWATPVLTPAQIATLTGSLPAFSEILRSASLTAGGAGSSAGYHANDVLTLVGGTHSVAATITVDTVDGGGGILTYHVSAGGTFSVVVNSFTVTGGAGSSAMFGTPIYGYAIGYPELWGGQQYRVYDVPTTGTQTHYGLISNHSYWSLGQNLTTSNVPGLSWSIKGQTMCLYLAANQMTLLHPGMGILLNDGSGDVPLEITGLYPGAGYVTVISLANGSGNTALFPDTKTTVYTGTAIKQPPFSFTNLNYLLNRDLDPSSNDNTPASLNKAA